MARRQINPARSDSASDELIEAIAGFRADPLGFVMFAFPWGEPGTRLARETGPDEWQKELLTRLADEIQRRDDGEELGAILMAVASGHGVGKAQPKSLMIDTPAGRRRFGDLRPGDLVFGSNGKPTRVVSVHDQGVLPVYRVAFDDRSSTTTCGDHLWNVRGRQQRRVGQSDEWLTMTTEQILAAGVDRPNGVMRARQWEIPQQGVVAYPFRWVPVSPYAMGVWLGDGCRKTGSFTSADPEAAVRIRRDGYLCLEKETPSAALEYTISNVQNGLRMAGVFECGAHEKHVPTIYLENIPEIRADVLRGLLDSDGTVTPTGAIIFTSVSVQLANDVAWLCRSLGGKAVMHDARPSSYRRPGSDTIVGRPSFHVTLTMPDGFRSFEIGRKQERVRAETRKRYLARWISSIELLPEPAECMCIKVEALDSLYLTNDFIVTHNTAIVAMIIIWFASCRIDPAVVVTANTLGQLTGKTWRELAKWHRLAINADWFQWTATTFYLKDRPETHKALATPWSKEKSEAFAGTHEEDVLMMFDEASAIDDVIWTVAEGALTTPGAIWLAFGNPTKNTGRFREAWRKFRHRWITFKVDSRNAKKADKAQIQKWIQDYGEDSDFVRVRVKGDFPRAASLQLIGSDLIDDAQFRYRARHGERLRKVVDAGPGGGLDRYRLDDNPVAPRLLLVDVARFGDDQSVIGMRCGRTFVVLAKYRELGVDQLSYRVAEWISTEQPDHILVDGAGVGGGVCDLLRGMGHEVIEVNAGVAALNKNKFANRRAEMWWLMRDWLANGGMLEPADNELADDLTSPEYGFSDRGEKVQLESKDDMRARGLPSPDSGDCLSFSFWMPFAARQAGPTVADRIAAATRERREGYGGIGERTWMSN